MTSSPIPNPASLDGEKGYSLPPQRTAARVGAEQGSKRLLEAYDRYRDKYGPPRPVQSCRHKVSFAGYDLHRLLRPSFGLTVAVIQREVADYFHIPRGEMTSARRVRAVARPRQIAMYLSRELTKQSFGEIGRRFGCRDHTTVLHACRQIDRLRATLPEVENDIQQITARLRARRW